MIKNTGSSAIIPLILNPKDIYIWYLIDIYKLDSIYINLQLKSLLLLLLEKSRRNIWIYNKCVLFYYAKSKITTTKVTQINIDNPKNIIKYTTSQIIIM